MTTPVRRRRPELDRLPHMVYELYGADHQPLYVGCTSSLPARLGAHASKHWWHDIVEMRVTTHPNAGEGLAAERDLIQQLQPFYNVQSADAGAELAREGHRRRRASAETTMATYGHLLPDAPA